MKKVLFSIAMGMMTLIQAKELPLNDQLSICSLNDLSSTQLQSLIRSPNSEFVLQLNEGDSFPVRFLSKTPLISAMIDPNLNIKIEKSCYLCIVNKKCYISEDLVNWEKANKWFSGKTLVQLDHGPNQDFIVESTLVPHNDETESD